MPRSEDSDNVPYQFELPRETHAKGMQKASDNGLDVAPFMRMAFEEFADRPIEESMRMLREHKDRKENGTGSKRAARITLNK